ncbi:class I SAM-dependent methyltransferase [Superficieibacter sp. HKU1]|uniref:class I SAM-dependent methyltransferase n=1 Tax=Superficieibacter sp. HKU1 TaxID=3031919 RepID=UPI0023E0AD17|nr:class I SAM-dependent methyltransferase [Superficieibacter sp. HKU1]WES69045.1 class I SAM-dependent methyltransferase [Superficieibacter sp. HKU1]
MTLKYYQQHADRFFTSTVSVDMSSLYQPFVAALPDGATVLDAGCGSGRDSKAFAGMGYRVEAFDASAQMVALATVFTGLDVQEKRFDQLEAVARYDGIWCCASLLHVSQAELPEVMQRLARALKPDGVWYVSFKYGDGERVQEGRHFTDLNEAALERLVALLEGITIASTWQTVDKRPDRHETWLNALLRKI